MKFEGQTGHYLAIIEQIMVGTMAFIEFMDREIGDL